MRCYNRKQEAGTLIAITLFQPHSRFRLNLPFLRVFRINHTVPEYLENHLYFWCALQQSELCNRDGLLFEEIRKLKANITNRETNKSLLKKKTSQQGEFTKTWPIWTFNISVWTTKSWKQVWWEKNPYKLPFLRSNK